jgi:hypothetical protein
MGEARIDLGGGAALAIAVPDAAREEPAEALPAFDVATVPGARVVGRRGFRDEAVSVRIACASAPSRGFAPGVEELVVARASVLARAAVPGLERWDEKPAAWLGVAYEQRVEGRVASPAGVVAARARHVLGFVGEARDAVACSIVCAEPEGASRCEPVVAGARVCGLVAPPAPSLVVRAVLASADHPRVAGALVVGIGLALVALVLARRPRPRR